MVINYYLLGFIRYVYYRKIVNPHYGRRFEITDIREPDYIKEEQRKNYNNNYTLVDCTQYVNQLYLSAYYYYAVVFKYTWGLSPLLVMLTSANWQPPRFHQICRMFYIRNVTQTYFDT